MTVRAVSLTPARITGWFEVAEVPGESRQGRACVRLLQPLEYRVGSADSDEVVTVPVGFVTDFASIPWGFRNLFSPMGRWSRPAIVHDFLYRTCGSGVLEAYNLAMGWPWRGITRQADYSRAEADRIFREAMGVVDPKVPAWQREVMYRAVRLGGEPGWGRP